MNALKSEKKNPPRDGYVGFASSFPFFIVCME